VPHALGEPGAVPGYPAFGRRSSLATPDRKTFRRVERRDARKVTRIPFRSRRPVRTSGVFARASPGHPFGRRREDGRQAGGGMFPPRQRSRVGPAKGTAKRRKRLMTQRLRPFRTHAGHPCARLECIEQQDRASARGSSA
jgi:hypothetical protein